MLVVQHPQSQQPTPVKMSMATMWAFAWPCFPVLEVETSMHLAQVYYHKHLHDNHTEELGVCGFQRTYDFKCFRNTSKALSALAMLSTSLDISQLFYSQQSCPGPTLAGASLDHKVRALADLTGLPQLISSCFFGCTGPYTLGPCLRKCLRMHTRNGKDAYAGVFLD